MASTTENITALVNGLKEQLVESTIVTPESLEYANNIKRWADSAERKAAVCVMAKSAEDISKALVLAQKYDMDIAVRGGGHAPSGSNSSEGIVVDLSQMRQVTVDVDNKTATCQGGCTWDDVDLALGNNGLACVGGTVTHTGIGGLTLGGGYGWLSGRYGLVIDNLLSVKAVLADGRIVMASESENQDLFWALRGAGHNFGVCVEFTYRAHPLSHEVYAGVLMFTPDKLEEIINFSNTLPEHPDENASGLMVFGCPPGQSSPIVGYAVFYNGPEELGKEKFRPLFDLEPFGGTVSMKPYAEANAMLNGHAPFGGWDSFHASTFSLPADPKFIRTVLDEFTSVLEKYPELSSSGMLWEFHNPGKILQVPQTATAFANRSRLQNVTVKIEHNNPAKHEEFSACGRDIRDMFKKELARTGMETDGSVGVYINYEDDQEVDVFGVNLERLQRLKGRYDPTNVFNKTHPISPVFEN